MTTETAVAEAVIATAEPTVAPEVAEVTARDGRQMLMISRAEFHRMVETRRQARVATEAQRKRADQSEVRASNWQTAFLMAAALVVVLALALIAEVLR